MKRQDYSIKFKSDQGNVATAIRTFGGLFPRVNSAIKNHVAIGGISDDVITLSEDGLVLTVSRRMTDSCYNERRLLYTDDSMYSIAQSASAIDSCSFPSFIDI